jgi:UDP:flavonoid glycosyltransferase YjiC (YdhE family)
MRILMVTSALASHYFALAPFGWAARAAGHEVTVATTPDLVPVVRDSGLPAVPVGAAVDFTGQYRDSARREGGPGDPKALFGAVAAAMVDDLVAYARWWRPDLVVWEPTTFAAPVAAAAIGVPAVRYLWGPDIVGRGSSGRDRLPESVRALFGRYGTDADAGPDWWTIDPCPPSVQLAGPRWQSVQYLPYSNQSRVPVELLTPPARPRVLVTLGVSVTGLVGDQAFLPPVVLRALAGADLEVLVALPPQQQHLLGDLPGNARVVTGCPLQALMPGCALVVHHGGAGSLLTAARYGVPQLMLTQMPDLGFYAGRLAGTGAGLHLRGDEAGEEAVRAAAHRLLDEPAFPAAADRLRAEALDQPTPADLAARLEQFLHQPTGVRS